MVAQGLYRAKGLVRANVFIDRILKPFQTKQDWGET